MDDAVTELRRQFGGATPEGVEALDAESVRDLADALRQARRRQNAHLRAATEASIAQVPRLLRPVVRRVVGL
ncbi:MAG: hypothetical protein M3548_21830 [Actinomycetota bacterium]|nr:hypothetical protein [Actinomycetota bacterium]